jgi:hypothetical protein
MLRKSRMPDIISQQLMMLAPSMAVVIFWIARLRTCRGAIASA